MLFCLKLLFLLSPALLGAAVTAFTLTTSKEVVEVNVRQNATLQWNYDISAGEAYDIYWGTSSGGTNVKELLFKRNEGQSEAQPSSNMPSKFAGRLKIIKQATLFIQRVDLSDDGSYICQINGQFVTLRKPIQLIVIDPPQILQPLQQVYVWNEGNSTELACRADGKPKPKVTWKKGNVVLKQERKVAKLDFPSVSYKDAGMYTCIAENAGGRKQTQVQIDVLYKPVVQLRLQSSSDNSLSFTWSLLSEDSSNMSLLYYTLRYRTADTNSWKTAPKIPSDTTTYQLRDLKPYTDYAVELFATNKHFTSDPSRAKARTTEATPSEPQDQQANTTGPYSVRLSWKKPRELNGIVVLFKVEMLWRFKNVMGDYRNDTRIIPAKVTSRERRRRATNGGFDYTVLQLEPERKIELRNLQPFAIITIRVAEGTRDPKQNILWSPLSNNQTVETKEGGPSAPRNAQLTDKKATSLKVTWLSPEFPNGIIKKYRIIYSNNTGKNYTVEVTKGLNNATLFYTISGLQKDTDYQIYVQAFTANFPGEVSPPVSRHETKPPGDVLEQSGPDNASLYGGVSAGIIILAFVIIVALVIRQG